MSKAMDQEYDRLHCDFFDADDRANFRAAMLDRLENTKWTEFKAPGESTRNESIRNRCNEYIADNLRGRVMGNQ